jgi:pimeloyl-ACP methyl ester carboxylesterase
MDMRSELSRIRTRTLVIAGGADQATPVEQSRVIAGQIRKSKLVVIPEASHLANVVKAQAFSDQLLRYLGVA